MKTMKQALSLLIALTMVLSMAVAGFTATTAKIVFTSSTNAPAVGEEFTVTAKVTANDNGFNALSVPLTWNDQVVQFLGFETTYDEDTEEDVLVSDFSGFMITYNEANGFVSFARAKDSTKTGTLFTAKFKAIAAGNSNISYYTEKFNMTFGNGEAVNISLDVSSLIKMSAVTDHAQSTTADYTVSLTPAIQAKAKNEMAEVKLNIASTTNTTFNTLYAKLTYDPTYLTLNTTSLSGYTMTDSNGTITIAGYGANKAVGDVLTLRFTVLNAPTAGTAVNLTKVNVDVSENANAQNAPEAAYGDQTAKITLSGYSVSYPESDFTGADTAKPGADYTLTALNKYYDYTFNATMGGQKATVIDNGNGIYTIKNVTGDLDIAIATKVGKSFAVTVSGAETSQVTAAGQATYGKDYSFAVGAVANKNTTVKVTIGGTAYTGFAVTDGVYTVQGMDITGAVAITITNTAALYTVTPEGTGAGDFTQVTDKLEQGGDYTFRVEKQDGFTYTISATMGGTTATVIDNGDGTYTIQNVTGNLVITVIKTEIPISTATVEVQEYMKVNASTIYLVTAVDASLGEGKALAYDGNMMFWSEQYQAYVYLVILDTVLDQETAARNIAEMTATTIVQIDYTGDVNGTEVIDINDAQLVYDIYNAKYTDFDVLAMKKFLRADVNGDKAVNVADAVAVVNTIIVSEDAGKN